MALIGEAGLQCGLDEWLTLGQKLPRQAHASLHKVGMWCDSYFAREASQQLEATDAGKSGQLSERHRGFRCRVQALDGSRNAR